MCHKGNRMSEKSYIHIYSVKYYIILQNTIMNHIYT